MQSESGGSGHPALVPVLEETPCPERLGSSVTRRCFQ